MLKLIRFASFSFIAATLALTVPAWAKDACCGGHGASSDKKGAGKTDHSKTADHDSAGDKEKSSDKGSAKKDSGKIQGGGAGSVIKGPGGDGTSKGGSEGSSQGAAGSLQ